MSSHNINRLLCFNEPKSVCLTGLLPARTILSRQRENDHRTTKKKCGSGITKNLTFFAAVRSGGVEDSQLVVLCRERQMASVR